MENIQKEDTLQIEELLRRIEELEDGHAHLKQNIFNLMMSRDQQLSSRPRQSTVREGETASSSFQHCPPLRSGGAARNGGGVTRHSAVKLTEAQYFNILQSIDEPIHITDAKGFIIYRNRAWEKFYGYTAAEALGKDVIELMIGPMDAPIANKILQQILNGESHSGEFVVRNKKGEKFLSFGSSKPLRDENGTVIGIMGISPVPCPYQEISPKPNVGAPTRIASQQPLQSDLATKVKSKMKNEESRMYHEGGNGEFSSMTNSGYNKPMIHDILSAKAEWMVKNGIGWPWKGNERKRGGFDSRTARFCWHWLYHSDQEHEYGLQMSSCIPAKLESQPWVNTNTLGTRSSLSDKVYEIKWDDLMIRERIGRGSYGSVYHAVWYGSDVAIKLFPTQEYSCDLILSFRHEVSLMKKLRHPNIVLFMGVVSSPPHLCIVTEFLCRGSLFHLLHRKKGRFNWKHRVHMAIDIARGMNYLHHCHPPIIHCDLKSSNLGVDKNWTVKISDVGLCHIKHETEGGIGTPEWMAPEVLRNEVADEKSDVYSYGVVLWEITTEKIPWDGLNWMQVIKAVGFMNQRLDIPKDVDPQWASLIERCLCSEPESRPTFQEILDELKELQFKFRPALHKSTVKKNYNHENDA